jgi:hypothetical protein
MGQLSGWPSYQGDYMQFDTGSIISLAGLVLTVLAGVYRFGQLSQRLSGLEKCHDDDVKSIRESNEKHEAHNVKQIEELYNSRNNTAETLAKLTALFESMEKKQESMDSKLDILIERRGTMRP